MDTPRWSATAKRVVVLVLLVGAIYVVSRAGEIVRPFMWAAIVAYVLLPVVNALQRRGLPRTAAAGVVFVFLLAVIFGGGRILIPLAFGQLRDLQGSVPGLVARAQQTVAELVRGTPLDDLDEIIFSRGFQDVAEGIARMAVPVAVGVARFLLELLVFLIGTFFLLRDAPKLYAWVRRVLPQGHSSELLPLFGQVNELLGKYVRGQVLLIAIMWTATTIGLTLLGVPFSLVLGFLTGVLETIPIVGPITAGAIAVLIALGHPSPLQGLLSSQLAYAGAVAVMYTVLRHAEDYFVIPVLIGRIVRLHPAVVIFALLTGGALYGLLGILLAVPAAATLRLVLIYVSAKLRDEDPFPRLERELATTGSAASEARDTRTVGGQAQP